MAQVGKRKPPAAGKGRKKGTPNKLTRDVKEAIMKAFELEGGVDYLRAVAKKDAKTFCALLGKVIPLQVAGDPNNPIQTYSRIEFAIVNAQS
jgi:hypothetical protein